MLRGNRRERQRAHSRDGGGDPAAAAGGVDPIEASQRPQERRQPRVLSQPRRPQCLGLGHRQLDRAAVTLLPNHSQLHEAVAAQRGSQRDSREPVRRW